MNRFVVLHDVANKTYLLRKRDIRAAVATAGATRIYTYEHGSCYCRETPEELSLLLEDAKA